MATGVIASARLLGLGGGGGGGPVTETAFSDFKNGVYRLSGSTVTVADLWENNTDFGAAWNSSSIVGGSGLPVGTTNSSPCMTASALAIVSPSDAGFVAVLNLSVPATPGEFEVHLRAVDYSFDGNIVFSDIDFIYGYSPNGTYGQIYGITGAYPAGANKIAIRISATDAAARNVAGDSFVATGAAGSVLTLLGITGYVGGGQTAVAIQDITFYPVATALVDAITA